VSFAFLNPLFWFAALALAAPVWLHLRRKAETNKVKFSALRFLDDQPLARRDPFRLRDWLLFLLRALALLLLVGAFAWPYQHKAAELAVKESRVYILDNTLSHQASQGFQHDREELRSEMMKVGRDAQVAVIELAGQPRVIGSFGDDRQAIADRLKDLPPSFQRGSYLAAFQQAGTLLANSLGARKKIILYGDNQENQWSENLNSPPFLRNVEVVLPKTAAAPGANLSLSQPRLQRIFLGEKSLVNLTMELTHSGAAREANVSLVINGQVIFNRNLQLGEQSGGISLQAQWETDPGLWLRGEATVTGAPDVLPADNRLFFSLAPLTEGKVVVLAQSPYLRSALSPDVMRGEWAARIVEPTAIANELGTNEDADVLVIESNYLQLADARKLLHRYLDNGHGVLLMVNRVTPAISGYLRELGFEPQPEPAAAGPTVEHIKFVLGNHPIFHPFVSSDYGNLTEIKLYKYARLKTPNGMPLVLSESGNGLFFQGSTPRGKLFVAAFGFDREQTSWPVHQTFIPFLDLTLQTARAADPTPLDYEPGAAGLVQLPSDTKVHQVVLRDQHRELARVPVTQGRAQLALPEIPGLYDLMYDTDSNVQKVLSVNPSPKESQLTYVKAPAAITNWEFNTRVETPTFAESPAIARMSAAAIWHQQFWWWLIVFGLLFLVLETAVAARRREGA
jgi:hypothetical protein